MSDYLEDHGCRAYVREFLNHCKPCPFCSGSPRWRVGFHAGNDFESGAVECRECGTEVSGILYSEYLRDPIEAAERHPWNIRAEHEDAQLRCADCAHCKPVADGSGLFCELWRHRTRADGYCHMGEVK